MGSEMCIRDRRYAAHQIRTSGAPDGAQLVLFDFDRCTGDLSAPISKRLPSIQHFGTPGIAFSERRARETHKFISQSSARCN